MQELEIKLFIITKFFDALYNSDRSKVRKELKSLLHHNDLDDEYWDKWLKRYETIAFSKEVQIMLLRQLEYPYRRIQNMVGVSPKTIQHISSQYELDYKPLDETVLLTDNIQRLATRLERGGISLW